MIIPTDPNTDPNFSSNAHSQMFNLSKYSTNFTYEIRYQSNINPNNNHIWSFPRPAVTSALASDQPVHPPGTDPYANSVSYPRTHAQFQGQAPFGEDPNAGSQNWAVEQAAPFTYEASIKSLYESLLVPTGATVPVAYNVMKNITLPSQTGSVELDIKRRKILGSGAAIDSLKVCEICNVACNSQEVWNKHLAGKRHKAQATLMSLDAGPYFAAVRSQFNGMWKKDPNKVKFVQSAWCEVCKINCNSNDAYIKHLVGKKHQKNLKGFSTSIVPSTATNTIIGPMENPGAKSLKGFSQPQAPEEDLETKKRKIISGGAAAGAVRTCKVCNVVCNSITVFASHLAGQKHAAMVKKKQTGA